MAPDPRTAAGFVAAIAAFPALNAAVCPKPPVPLDIAWIAANLSLYAMGIVGQLGHLARVEAPAGTEREKRMPALA